MIISCPGVGSLSEGSVGERIEDSLERISSGSQKDEMLELRRVDEDSI